MRLGLGRKGLWVSLRALPREHGSLTPSRAQVRARALVRVRAGGEGEGLRVTGALQLEVVRVAVADLAPAPLDLLRVRVAVAVGVMVGVRVRVRVGVRVRVRRPRCVTSIPVTYIFEGHSHSLSSTSLLNQRPDQLVQRLPHLSLKSYRSRSSERVLCREERRRCGAGAAHPALASAQGRACSVREVRRRACRSARGCP